MFELINTLIALALFAIAVLLGKAGFEYFISLPVGYLFATAIPSFAKLVRRLHDTNHRGWWVLISAVPFVGPIILLFFTVKEATRARTASAPTPRRCRWWPPPPRWVTSLPGSRKTMRNEIHR